MATDHQEGPPVNPKEQQDPDNSLNRLIHDVSGRLSEQLKIDPSSEEDRSIKAQYQTAVEQAIHDGSDSYINQFSPDTVQDASSAFIAGFNFAQQRVGSLLSTTDFNQMASLGNKIEDVPAKTLFLFGSLTGSLGPTPQWDIVRFVIPTSNPHIESVTKRIFMPNTGGSESLVFGYGSRLGYTLKQFSEQSPRHAQLINWVDPKTGHTGLTQQVCQQANFVSR